MSDRRFSYSINRSAIIRIRPRARVSAIVRFVYYNILCSLKKKKKYAFSRVCVITILFYRILFACDKNFNNIFPFTRSQNNNNRRNIITTLPHIRFSMFVRFTSVPLRIIVTVTERWQLPISAWWGPVLPDTHFKVSTLIIAIIPYNILIIIYNIIIIIISKVFRFYMNKINGRIYFHIIFYIWKRIPYIYIYITEFFSFV